MTDYDRLYKLLTEEKDKKDWAELSNILLGELRDHLKILSPELLLEMVCFSLLF